MRFILLTSIVVLVAIDSRAGEPTFQKIVLDRTFLSEGANVGDFNHDGKMDVVSGPYWYEGPDFKKRHEYYPAKEIDPHGYSKNFLAFTDDFNRDGWTDILVVGFPGEDASWFENPQGGEGMWTKHLALEHVDDESPGFEDLARIGSKQIICANGGRFGYAAPDAKHPDQPWTFHPITPPGPYQRFTHGLGVGDVNGDGRADLLEATGWWEHPSDLSGDPVWQKHDEIFGKGGAQMYAVDLTGDKQAEIITSIEAHGYGLAWFNLVQFESRPKFMAHRIMGDKPEQNPPGMPFFSQLHAVAIADIDGDGIPDIVTGKRYWAHGPEHDPEPNAPAVLYWYQTKRTDKEPGLEFVAHKIDDDSGVGTQVVATDVNGDGAPDIVVGNKKGTFVFLQQR
jgi:hypothetical protein